MPLWAGVLITAADSFAILLVERLGIRLLEAIFGGLISVMAISFGVMYFWAEVPTGKVLEGAFLFVPPLPPLPPPHPHHLSKNSFWANVFCIQPARGCHVGAHQNAGHLFWCYPLLGQGTHGSGAGRDLLPPRCLQIIRKFGQYITLTVLSFSAMNCWARLQYDYETKYTTFLGIQEPVSILRTHQSCCKCLHLDRPHLTRDAHQFLPLL